MKNNKKIARVRRAMKMRKKLIELRVLRLAVYKSSKHIYAQIFSTDNTEVLVSASTVEKEISTKLDMTGNKKAASLVGQVIAERALKKGIMNVAFDRSGFKYHGRVQVLADCARQFGLKF
ncbi:50S ribosomal protein L18 [Candidatus Blochmanniella vafra str. BVAF]|uniref:Large ribosomal subunit protein uL18 n=1 Tax=Blochmanniella vafra (strain BVAF) TaxID=859654 RepID=E8Q5Z3_BLOVB|nr:50S ribosomal protein L18 [Candidatus Blochmannia vafer]ADV33609.1 50S ribosomal protein L18 [Candidatus Blochmannia vafer str. BVAF]